MTFLELLLARSERELHVLLAEMSILQPLSPFPIKERGPTEADRCVPFHLVGGV